MSRPLSIALIVTFCLALTARGEDKPSPAVKRILDKAVAEVKKNRQEFAKANQKPLDEARQELQDLSTKLIKDGKAEEATAVLRQVGTLEDDVMKMANAPAPGVGRAVPRKPLLERMVGNWTHPNEPTIFQIEPNGDTRQILKADGKVIRQGQMRVMADGTAEVMLAGHRYKVSEAGADRLAAEVWLPSGQPWEFGLVMTRIK